MKPTRRKQAKLPRARVMELYATREGRISEVLHHGQASRMAWQMGDTINACAVIPCRTRREAQEVARFFQMTEKKRAEALADALGRRSGLGYLPAVRAEYLYMARAVLAAIKGGKP